MSLAPGTLIGQYRVSSLLGEGGMGAVYYAEHVVLGRPAAIKVLHHHIARDANLVQRFINEARIAAAMNHRNVVDVLDCGMFPVPNAPDAQWYIALEFLHGKSLGSFIAERNGQPIDLPTILHVLAETANGLHAAHEKHNLVHRDIKPDNLFLTQTEDDPMRVKILDFGIAKLRQPGSGVQTHSQTAMGTPAYAAPEQLRDSKDVDRRADVWALGVIAHEMATGQRPWGATISVYEIIAHHAQMKKAPDPRALRPELPKAWAEVVSRAMEPDVRRRWGSAKDFIRALADATPMPFSGTGLALLEKVAKELVLASSHSVTVGRRLPPELQVDAAPIATAPERPSAFADPLTVSDGVPRAPGTERMGITGGPVSTIGGSAGQSVPVPQPSSRRGLILSGAVIVGAGGLGVAVALMIAGGRVEQGEPPQAGADRGPARDAGTETTQLSALAIVTTPDGAEIVIDGVSRGPAPLNVELPVGAEVEIRGELAGHASATRTLRITASPSTVQLRLTPIADAGSPDAASKSDPPDEPRRGTKPTRGTGKPRRHPQDPGTGAGSSSGAGTGTGGTTFDPNDVL